MRDKLEGARERDERVHDDRNNETENVLHCQLGRLADSILVTALFLISLCNHRIRLIEIEIVFRKIIFS